MVTKEGSCLGGAVGPRRPESSGGASKQVGKGEARMRGSRLHSLNPDAGRFSEEFVLRAVHCGFGGPILIKPRVEV